MIDPYYLPTCVLHLSFSAFEVPVVADVLQISTWGNVCKNGTRSSQLGPHSSAAVDWIWAGPFSTFCGSAIPNRRIIFTCWRALLVDTFHDDQTNSRELPLEPNTKLSGLLLVSFRNKMEPLCPSSEVEGRNHDRTEVPRLWHPNNCLQAGGVIRL